MCYEDDGLDGALIYIDNMLRGLGGAESLIEACPVTNTGIREGQFELEYWT